MKCLLFLHSIVKITYQDNESPRPLKKLTVLGQVLREGRRLQLLAQLPFAVHSPGLHHPSKHKQPSPGLSSTDTGCA